MCIGKRFFAVDNGGFTVYNIWETYKAGINFKVEYAIRPTIHISAKYSYIKFDESNKKLTQTQ